MSKKLAFIQPLIKDGNYTPPLGPLILAAIIEKKGWEVAFFDEKLNNSALKELISFRPDIIGISAVTPSILRGKSLAQKIKLNLPKTIIIFGGPHPSVLPEEAISWNCTDFVITGEGEKALANLCDWYIAGKNKDELKNIPNLCYKLNNKIIQNKRYSFLTPQELDSLPTPAFHLLDIEKVFKNSRHGLFSVGSRVLPIMSSRGCPNSCTYCCRHMGFKIRYRDPELVINEIKYMISKYNIDEVWFEDDNFTVNKKRTHKILDSIIENNLGINLKFANGLRADGVDKAILEKMKKAGCYSISFGIESGSPKILKMMKKNLSLEKARENITIAKGLGFLVGANFIIGYPGETIEDIEKSLDYFIKLNLDSMAVVNLIPFPGTEARKICEENGYLTDEAGNWDNYIFNIENPKILIETKFQKREEIVKMINKIYKKFYLNSQRIYKILKRMKAKDILRGAKVMLSKLK